MRIRVLAITTAWLAIAPAVQAEIKVGAILSLTGAAASLGIPAKNAIDLFPKSFGNETIKYVVIDDSSDPSSAVRAAKKLIDEEGVDLILGPSVTPTSLAVTETVASSKTPMISVAGSSVIAKPAVGPKQWVFKVAPEEPSMAARVFGQMARDGNKTVGFIGFNDAFGDSFIGAFKEEAGKRGFQVVADERYHPRDTSVTSQVLQVMQKKPDAIVIGASGTPGVGPVIELRGQNYRGSIYINQGMANPDVLRVGGMDLNGVRLAVPPVLVAEQLNEDDPIKPVALAFVKAYEEKYGAGSRSLFGATVWDGFLIAQNALPKAMQKSAPGNETFRTALRDAMEETSGLIGTQGFFTLSKTNHNGTDERSEVLVAIDRGKWVYIPEPKQK